VFVVSNAHPEVGVSISDDEYWMALQMVAFLFIWCSVLMWFE
jgi:hypothetical protein